MLQVNVAQLFREPVGSTRLLKIEEKTFQTDDLQVRALRGDILLTRLRGELLVQGQLKGEVTLECSRCLEPYTETLILDLEAIFRPAVAIGTDKPLPPPEDDTVFHIDEKHVLDLYEVIREEIILSLPMQPVCRFDCAGLCPICGKNLNEGPCEGHAEQIDARLAVLAKLLTPEA